MSKVSKAQWKVGDRVIVDFDGTICAGAIKAFGNQGKRASVLFDDGDKLVIDTKVLTLEPSRKKKPAEPFVLPSSGDSDSSNEDEDEEGESEAGLSGFVVYRIQWFTTDGDRLLFAGPKDKWDDPLNAIRFHTAHDGFEFRGQWRKTRVSGDGEIRYTIDMSAKRGDKHYMIDTRDLCWDTDPREEIRSLNADICARINMWFHRFKIDGQGVDELQQRAMNPEIWFRRLESLDRFILSLKEWRDTLIHSGGERRYTLEGDEGGQRVTFAANLTTQAILLDGKPPKLTDGAVVDDVVANRNAKHRKDRKGTGRSFEHKPKDENVLALAEQLEKAKKSGDKKLQRTIRATMRRMGHSGGSRSASKLKAKGK